VWVSRLQAENIKLALAARELTTRRESRRAVRLEAARHQVAIADLTPEELRLLDLSQKDWDRFRARGATVKRAKRRTKRRRVRRRFRGDDSSHAPVGVLAEAQRALGFSKIRDYQVPDWFAGFHGVPGSLLRRPASELSDANKMKVLLVRLRYLTAAYKQQPGRFLRNPGREGSENPVAHRFRLRSPFEGIGPACAGLRLVIGGGVDQHYFAGVRYKYLARYLRTALVEFVNLPLSDLRSVRVVSGPACLRCSHPSCASGYYAKGRPPVRLKAGVHSAPPELSSESGV
jgi:hypothetical protein